MAVRALACLLAALLSVTAAFAESPPEAAVPDPVKLKADWWTYFAPAEPLDGEALSRRIEAAVALVQSYVDTAADSDKAEHGARRKQLLAALEKFRELKSAPLSAPAALPVSSAAAYTLDEALQKHAAWRRLKGEVDAARAQLGWQEVVFEDERKQQSRQRSRYLDMAPGRSARLHKGLDLMVSRVRLELQRLDLERRQAAVQLDELQVERLRAELDALASHLQASSNELAQWEQRRERARQALVELSGEVEQLRDDAVQPPTTIDPSERTQWRLVAAINLEIAIGVQELQAMQARLASHLIRLVSAAPDEADESPRQVLADNELLADSLGEQRTRWQSISQQVRAAVTAEAVDGTGQGRAGGSSRRQISTLLEALDQSLSRLDQQLAVNGFVAELLKARRHAAEGGLNRYFQDGWASLSGFWATGVDRLGDTLFEISETPVTTLGLLRVVLILTLAWWISKGIQRAIARVGERRGAISQSSLYTFGRLVHYTVLSVGILIGLSSIGIDFTKFALFASALGVGIGFGLQTLISNFVAGLIILFEKSLKVGDFVELESGVTGEVREINMRSTLLTTNDNVDILVPNSEFVGGRVTNWTMREAYRRIRVSFGVAYGTDKEMVKKAALEAAAEVRWTLKGVKGRQSQVWFVEFGDSSLNFELVVWLTPEAVKRPGAVNAAYLWEIESKLREYAIEVPFPQRDLHLRSLFGMNEDEARSVFPPAAGPQTGEAS